MAQLTPTLLQPTGIATSYQAASSAGDSFNNPTDERTFVHVRNGAASAITVTIAPIKATGVKVAGYGLLTAPTRSVTVPAAGDAMIGPFPPAYNDASNNVALAYSSATSVTVGAFRLPAQSF